MSAPGNIRIRVTLSAALMLLAGCPTGQNVEVERPGSTGDCVDTLTEMYDAARHNCHVRGRRVKASNIDDGEFKRYLSLQYAGDEMPGPSEYARFFVGNAGPSPTANKWLLLYEGEPVCAKGSRHVLLVDGDVALLTDAQWERMKAESAFRPQADECVNVFRHSYAIDGYLRDDEP